MKYISLAAIGNIPRFYFASLRNNKLSICSRLELVVNKTRADNPLKGAPWSLWGLRYAYKLFRTLFCAIGYYFMPFVSIFINGKFMIYDPPKA